MPTPFPRSPALALLLAFACSGQTTSGTGGSGGTSTGGSAGTGGTAGSDAGGICGLPQDPGPCDAAMPRWWFDAATGKCEPFVYGGCQGNANNFQSPNDCVKICAPNAAAPCDAITCNAGSQCLYASAPGFPASCAEPCGDGGTCPFGKTCTCGASCPGCKDCVKACMPS